MREIVGKVEVEAAVFVWMSVMMLRGVTGTLDVLNVVEILRELGIEARVSSSLSSRGEICCKNG